MYMIYLNIYLYVIIYMIIYMHMFPNSWYNYRVLVGFKKSP